VSAREYRILVTGSRNWWSVDVIRNALWTAYGDRPPGTDPVIVHGACPSGADSIASGWARSNGVKTEPHPADWHKYGKAAGPRRNREMVALGADICLAFIRAESRGASMTARMAEDAGIRTVRFVED
jgi:hypothetical protein